MISADAPAAAPSLLNDVHAFWAQRWSGPKLGWHKDEVNPHLMKHTDFLFECDTCEDDEGARIFVPLCGKSVDLAYLASHPKASHVVGVDVVRNAAVNFAAEHPEFSLEEHRVDQCGADAEEGQKCDNSDPSLSTGSSFHGKNLSIIIRDLFEMLPMDNAGRAEYITEGMASAESAPTEYLFDTIFDRASIVAIDPSLRNDYVTLMGELLKPGGSILLVTLDRRQTATDEAKKDGPPFSVDEAAIRQLYESQPWVDSVAKLEEVNDLTTEADRERWEKKGVLELYEIVFLIKKKN